MEHDWQRGGVITADGVPVAHADRSWFREHAEVQVGPVRWEFSATGSWFGRRPLVASVDGVERLRAVQTGFWSTTWTITGDGDPITLTTKGLLSRGLVLRRGGSEIGETGTSHLLTSRPRMTTTVPLPPDLAAFVLWVAYVDVTRRSSDAGGAAT